ncbi:MAG TPA: DUF2059 domain-containing protein [Candidatus Methylomirabilis sp.]|nr:DUF2059 domain-containing protein [Candidatus Methylomirabilis sp.]
MKAVLALVIIYVGTFLLAIQGASQNPVNAARQNAATVDQSSQATKAIDPAKDADIRSLMELTGARDQIQDAVANSSEQYKEKLLATVPENDKGQAFVAAFVDSYQKKFDANQVTEQIVAIYDKHYTDDEIKGLLQFYGSPIGQKVAAEAPKINREIQAASRAIGTNAAREALQALKAENPEIGRSARLGNGPRRWQQQGGRGQQRNQNQQVAQQPDPQQP